MGRQALGAAAKSKTGSVRVTPHEYKYFETTYGGLGKWLQRQVSQELAKAAEMQDEMERQDQPV